MKEFLKHLDLGSKVLVGSSEVVTDANSRDNIIGKDREVLVVSLMSNFPLKFREIIVNEIKI